VYSMYSAATFLRSKKLSHQCIQWQLFYEKKYIVLHFLQIKKGAFICLNLHKLVINVYKTTKPKKIRITT
jgi:hypothetical protein